MRGYCKSGVTLLRNSIIIAVLVICYMWYNKTKRADYKTNDNAWYRDDTDSGHIHKYTTIERIDKKKYGHSITPDILPVRTKPEQSAKHFSNVIIIKSAYWDSTSDVIKVLAFIKRTEMKNYNIVCQVRISGISIEQTSVHSMSCMDIFDYWPQDSMFYAFLCTCDSGKLNTIPANVQLKTITMNEQNKTNSNIFSVPILNSKLPISSKKKDIGICVKPLNGHIDVVRFVEWIEMHRIIGIQYFIVYVGDVNKSIVKVLEYYENLGIIKIVEDTFFEEVWARVSNGNSTTKYNLHEQSYILSYNDCLYRFREQVEEMFIVDTDEILVMERNSSIQELIRQYRQSYPRYNGLSFASVWHHEDYGVTNTDIPEYLHSQRYLKRSQIKYDHIKTIFKANVTEMVGWHMVHLSTGDKSPEDFQYHNLNVGWKNTALLHHFRETCRLGAKPCKDMADSAVIDTTLPLFRDKAQHRVYTILKTLLDK